MNSKVKRLRFSKYLTLAVVAGIALFIAIGNFSPLSADGAKLLVERHKAAGIECSSCHKETPPKEAVTTAVCTGCHGDYDTLARRTEKVEPNPHESHEGKIDCGACHHSHKASENYCARCHAFGFKVP
jgi:fumarate reductase flavoprotein subunit